MSDMLSEHEPAKTESTTSPTGYSPTPEEQRTIKKGTDIFERNKRHRKRVDEKWTEFYKMFRGKQWKEQRPSYRHSEVVNLVFQNIQASVPLLTDSRPQLQYVPQEPSDQEFSDILNQVCESDWQYGNWLYTLTETVYDSHVYGCGLGSMKYDPDARNGEGSAEMNSEDPVNFYPDPDAHDVNRKCENLVIAVPTDISKIKKDYPELGRFVKPDLIDMSYGKLGDNEQIRYKSPVDNAVISDSTSAFDVSDANKVLKLEVWLKDGEITEESVDKMDEQGKPSVDAVGQPVKEFIQKLKYPNGRKLVIAGGVLLEDKPNPYEDGKFPYARLVNYIDPHNFWGISDVEQTMGPQKIFNKLVSFSLDVLTLMGNPIWVVDTTAGVDTDNLFNRPGSVVEKEPGTEVRREAGVQLQPFVIELIDRFKGWFNDISGSNEESRGVASPGVTSGVAIQALQESSQTRIRQKSRNMDAFLQDIGQLYAARVLQFYSTPRIFRVTNDQGASSFFKMHITPNEDGTKTATVRDMAQGLDLEAKAYQIKGGFDVRVSTGSSLPFSKQERMDKALALFDRGILDPQEVLKAVDYPNWEAVLARVQQQQAQAAAQEQASAAAGKPLAKGA